MGAERARFLGSEPLVPAGVYRILRGTWGKLVMTWHDCSYIVHPGIQTHPPRAARLCVSAHFGERYACVSCLCVVTFLCNCCCDVVTPVRVRLFGGAAQGRTLMCVALRRRRHPNTLPTQQRRTSERVRCARFYTRLLAVQLKKRQPKPSKRRKVTRGGPRLPAAASRVAAAKPAHIDCDTAPPSVTWPSSIGTKLK